MNSEVQQRTAIRRRTWWIALGLWLALAALASAALWHLRREALDGQARELVLLSLALSDEIDRGLQGAEEGLHALRNELRDSRPATSGPAFAHVLRVRAELMPLIQTLWLLDRNGELLSASDATAPPALTTLMPTLDELSADAVAVSRPFADGSTKRSLVALAVRLADDDTGRAGGWIVAAMPATSLLGAFSAATPSADARMAVFRGDGVLLAGEIVARSRVDEATRARRLAMQPSIDQVQFPDGSQHLVGLQRLPRYGLAVVLTRDLAAVLGAWRETTQAAAVAAVLLLLIVAASVHLVQRAERRHDEARRALAAQLARASKLEALGTLAGGVSHDFNNLLSAIVGYGEMAQDAAPVGSAQARHIDRVLQAALRGKALIERILAFSRGGARASTVFELQAIVEEVLALLTASLRPGVLLERRLDAPDARLRGDPTQAFEAVMNLCTNAMQAMPGGGMLSVRLQRLHVSTARVLSHSPLASGDYLALSVSDEGSGIAPPVMERLFEPFFTTRAAQSGTGLGLAVVHGVVAEFGGAIDVQSAPGQGARFTLYLPECTDAAAAPLLAPAQAPAGRGQALLVVDDELALVGLTVELLSGLGYAPVGYNDPAAALEAVRADPQRFAAVITDEVMPGLSGTQLTEAVRRQAPNLPVLLVSGWGGALLATRAAAAGVTRVLAKPLQRAQLARALAELLG